MLPLNSNNFSAQRKGEWDENLFLIPTTLDQSTLFPLFFSHLLYDTGVVLPILQKTPLALKVEHITLDLTS
jgi:hypothetical protein